MEIRLIRHGKVNMDWKKRYNSSEYDCAWDEYDTKDILPIEDRLEIPKDAKVFVTTYKRTHQTAEQFLGAKEYEIIESLADEVPLRSFIDTKHRFSRRLMNFLGRVEWYLPLKRQPERRRASYLRALRFIDYIESRTDNAVIVMHGFFIRTVCRALKRRGYKLDHQPIFGVPNLIVVDAVRKDPPRKKAS